MALLQGPSPKQLELIRQELGEGEGDLERGVREIRTMCAASPHLPPPETIDTRFLELFVRGCRMDAERARSKFDAFCAARARHRDLFQHRSLSEPPLNDVCNFLDIVPLPKLTDEGLRVTVFRVRPQYPEGSADVAGAVRAVLLVSDVRMRDEAAILGDVFVWDLRSARGSLAARIASAAGTVRRGVHLAAAAYPQRLLRIHIVGAPPFIASALHMIRSCMNEKVKRRFYLNAKVEELLEQIPARVLPAEWGGEEESVDVLARKWRNRVDELRDYLRDLNEIMSQQDVQPVDSDIYGTVGAFRKLDID